MAESSETDLKLPDDAWRVIKDNKQALVIVTHDEKLAEVSSKIIHMRDGVLIGLP